MVTPPPNDTPVLLFKTPAAWERWLAKHHGQSKGLWVRMAKKDSGLASITYPEALQAALCYGWIDGQKKGEDEQYWQQKFTPRGARSIWSKINRDKALALIEQGLMQPAGLAEVKRAQADGRWEAAYDGQRTATVPLDLQAALDANKKARDFFATLDSVNRYAILFRTHNAKKAETRAKRIAQFVAMLARHEKIHAK
ncbi:MAG: YdeI/OmpD-associated family protein [Cytophagales bacterium]|nr:YdeI/OmpD-associated family protein [Rhizobacter sp.]